MDLKSVKSKVRCPLEGTQGWQRCVGRLQYPNQPDNKESPDHDPCIEHCLRFCPGILEYILSNLPTKMRIRPSVSPKDTGITDTKIQEHIKNLLTNSGLHEKEHIELPVHWYSVRMHNGPYTEFQGNSNAWKVTGGDYENVDPDDFLYFDKFDSKGTWLSNSDVARYLCEYALSRSTGPTIEIAGHFTVPIKKVNQADRLIKLVDWYDNILKSAMLRRPLPSTFLKTDINGPLQTALPYIESLRFELLGDRETLFEPILSIVFGIQLGFFSLRQLAPPRPVGTVLKNQCTNVADPFTLQTIRDIDTKQISDYIMFVSADGRQRLCVHWKSLIGFWSSTNGFVYGLCNRLRTPLEQRRSQCSQFYLIPGDQRWYITERAAGYIREIVNAFGGSFVFRLIPLNVVTLGRRDVPSQEHYVGEVHSTNAWIHDVSLLRS